MKQAAVFLDRDGTINEQMGYINHISRFHLLPGAGEAIRLLNEQNIPVVVVSNQSGLARGYFPESLLAKVHEKMSQELARAGAHIDGIYICPHHPEAKLPELRINCSCRKPKTGLLERAARDLHLDLSRSYLIGDRWTDIKTAANCGATPVLVLTGYGRGDLEYIGPSQKNQPHHIADNLIDAVRWILSKISDEKYNARKRNSTKNL
jgi:D-glycero-D-manno-heptose 1,7-bisphosphate phosphatase